jgi:uncharacterized protein YdeI (YjbR/CyaY-like superfamily)
MVQNDIQEDNSFHAPTRAAWRKWLQANHRKKDSTWLIIYHKGSETPSVYYDEAVEEALCFGWIDSVKNKRDHESAYQYFGKRKPGSKWSKLNKERVRKLMKAGKIHKSGLAMIDLAKKTGTWTALDEIEKMVMPPDLAKHFKRSKTALRNFEAFPPSTKKAIYHWIISARQEATRTKRVIETVRLAEKNVRANQWVPK